MTGSESDRGLLLVGHGTVDPCGSTEFMETAADVARVCGGVPVEPCFLELAEPDIQTGVARLAQRGVKHLTVAPLLLFAAGHAKHDIPRGVAAAVARYPG